MNLILQKIRSFAIENKKTLAILIDPDKFENINFGQIELTYLAKIDFVFIGGSLITTPNIEDVIQQLKSKFNVPIILFPGNVAHISNGLDGILFLSLISGRNPDFLIGQHIIAAPLLRKARIEIMPTGYMLIESGKPTTANYMSNTSPIPADKPDIAVCTAMAGEMLGLQLIFMDAGSGASKPIDTRMIKSVKKNIDIPLIIGGGINTVKKAKDAYEAGADMIVIGNLMEDNSFVLNEIIDMKIKLNQL